MYGHNYKYSLSLECRHNWKTYTRLLEQVLVYVAVGSRDIGRRGLICEAGTGFDT